MRGSDDQLSIHPICYSWYFGPFLAVQQFLAIQHMLLKRNFLSYPWPSLPLFFTNLNFYKLEQLLLLRILRNLWTVGLWAFFNFVLFRYERLQNLLFLVLIRCLLSLFLWLQWKFLLLLRFLRHLRTFQGPSSPFFLSLEFGYVCYSCYSCHMCYSVLLDSGFLEALLGLFPF